MEALALACELLAQVNQLRDEAKFLQRSRIANELAYEQLVYRLDIIADRLQALIENAAP